MANTKRIIEESPNSKRLYRWTVTNGTIASATWSITPVLKTDQQTDTSTTTMIRIHKPKEGQTYNVSVLLVMTDGQEIQREFTLLGKRV